MAPQIVEIRDAEKRLTDLVKQVAEGNHVVLSYKGKPVAQLAPVGQRIAGLHTGAIWTSGDFDDPLPDDSWTEEK